MRLKKRVGMPSIIKARMFAIPVVVIAAIGTAGTLHAATIPATPPGSQISGTGAGGTGIGFVFATTAPGNDNSILGSPNLISLNWAFTAIGPIDSRKRPVQGDEIRTAEDAVVVARSRRREYETDAGATGARSRNLASRWGRWYCGRVQGASCSDSGDHDDRDREHACLDDGRHPNPLLQSHRFNFGARMSRSENV